MPRQILKGATDQSVILRIIDSTDGTPETGVVYNTTGIAMWYRREGATVTQITEATLAATDTAHSDGGIIHLSDGYYRMDLPDAACATGVASVMIGGAVTGMIVVGTELQLVNYNPQDGVRLGLTALPNAAADAAGGLAISDAGGLDLDAKLANTNEVTAARMGALTDWIDAGRLDTILDSILTDTGTTLDGRIPAALVSGRMDASVGAQANIDFGALQKASLNAATPASVVGAVGSVAGAVGSIAANGIAAASIATGAITNTKFAAGAIDAAAIATDAIDADAVAANAVTEIQAGLATAAAVTALNNLSAAQVNAEVVDALNVDTYVEPAQGIPGATISLAQKIGFLYKNWRNRKAQTATQFSLYNDDAATVDHKAAVSDNGTTFASAEVASGP